MAWQNDEPKAGVYNAPAFSMSLVFYGLAQERTLIFVILGTLLFGTRAIRG